MKSNIFVLIYVMVILAGGIAAFVPMPYKILGLALIIAAFVIPLISVFLPRNSLNQRSVNHGLELLMPALAQSAHIMTGGTMSDYYIDIDKLITDSCQAKHLIREMAGMIRELDNDLSIDKLVFIERDAGPVGAVGLLAGITSETGLDGLIVRTKRLVNNSVIKPYINLRKDFNVLLITDVVTGGGHLRHAVQALRQRLNQQSYHVVCYACRQPETIVGLKEEGIVVHSLYSPEEVSKGLENYAR